MDFETAMESTVTRDEAFAELQSHGFMADCEGGELFDCTTGETIAWANSEGEYHGADILGWLGY